MFINYKLTGMLSDLKFTLEYFIRRGMNERIYQVHPSKRHPKDARQSFSRYPARRVSSLFSGDLKRVAVRTRG